MKGLNRNLTSVLFLREEMIGKGQGISSYQYIIADAVVVSYNTLGVPYRFVNDQVKTQPSLRKRSEIRSWKEQRILHISIVIL